MSRSISFVASGSVDTRITITENDDGTLTFDLEVLGGLAIGAVSALYFDLVGIDTSDPGFTITGADVDATAFDEANVDTLGGSTNVNGTVTREAGDFDVGVSFSGTDPTQSTTSFTLASTDGLTLDALNLADFGLRLQPVDDGTGGSTGTSKTGASATGVATGDTLAVDENMSAGINLLSNDQMTDADGNSLGLMVDAVVVGGQSLAFDAMAGAFSGTITYEMLGELGTLTVTTDGQATFVADGAGSLGLNDGETASFKAAYTTVSSSGGTATAHLDVTVNGEGSPEPEVPEIDSLAFSGTWQFAFTDNISSVFTGTGFEDEFPLDPANANDVTAAFNILTDGIYIPNDGSGTEDDLNGVSNLSTDFGLSSTFTINFADPTTVDTFNFLSSRAFASNIDIIVEADVVDEFGMTQTVELGSMTTGELGIPDGGDALAYEIDLIETEVTQVDITISSTHVIIHEISFNEDLSPLLMMG